MMARRLHAFRTKLMGPPCFLLHIRPHRHARLAGFVFIRQSSKTLARKRGQVAASASCPGEPCMDFELPEDIRLLRDTVRKFVDRELIPIEMHSMDGPDLKPEVKNSLEAKARELGLWQLDTPAEFGGQGLSLLALAVVWEEVHPSIALPNRGDGVFGASPRPILLRLPEKMKERYLYPLLRGEKSAAFAQTEPEAGSDPGRMKTRAVRQGDHYVINGYKRFISHVKGADFLQ